MWNSASQKNQNIWQQLVHISWIIVGLSIGRALFIAACIFLFATVLTVFCCVLYLTLFSYLKRELLDLRSLISESWEGDYKGWVNRGEGDTRWQVKKLNVSSTWTLKLPKRTVTGVGVKMVDVNLVSGSLGNEKDSREVYAKVSVLSTNLSF